MAYSSSNTKLSINRWGELMGINPYVLNGVQVGSCIDAQIPYDCEQVWTQYRWQSAANATREQLGLAIKEATEDVEWKLGYPVAPTYIEKENIMLKHAEGGALAKTNTVLLYLDNKKIISAGRFNEDYVNTPTEMVTEDLDGDGFEESLRLRFYMGTSDSLTDEQVQRLLEPDKNWGVWIDVEGYFVGAWKESLYNMPEPIVINLMSEVDIVDPTLVTYYLQFHYHLRDVMDWKYISQHPPHGGYLPPDICVDDIHQRFKLFEKFPEPETEDEPFVRIYCREDSTCTENCAEQILPGILEVVDADSGLVAITLAQPVMEEVAPEQEVFVGFECATSSVECLPYRVEIDYLAGAQGEHVFMEHEIAKMAAARLPMPVCECGNYGVANSYRDDYAVYDKSAPRRATARLLDNPFGTRRGEVEAWMAIQKHIGDIQYAGLI